MCCKICQADELDLVGLFVDLWEANWTITEEAKIDLPYNQAFRDLDRKLRHDG